VQAAALLSNFFPDLLAAPVPGNGFPPPPQRLGGNTQAFVRVGIAGVHVQVFGVLDWQRIEEAQ